jgi:hypothetical protein
MLKADTAPSFKLTATGSERASFVQPRKRLPLKMVISEIASRNSDTVGTKPEYMTVSPCMDNMSLHTFLAKKKGPRRYFRSLIVLEVLVQVLNSLNSSICRHQSILVLLLLGTNNTGMQLSFSKDPGCQCIQVNIDGSLQVEQMDSKLVMQLNLGFDDYTVSKYLLSVSLLALHHPLQYKDSNSQLLWKNYK